MDDKQHKIQNEISELEQLVNQAKQNKNDPESEIAANIFHDLISTRMDKLRYLSGCTSKVQH